MIFKIFSAKIFAKKLAFLTQNKAKLCKLLIITLVFEKDANFLAENGGKSKKIVIIHNIDPWPSKNKQNSKWRRGLVVSSPSATEETGAMGREIESRQGIGW
jgi:hypothetical protein